MKDLLAYLNGLSVAERIAFARSAGTTVGYLRKAICVGARMGPALCVALERASNGVLRRWMFRPIDWWLIWPELIGIEGAPAVPSEKRARALARSAQAKQVA